jgi:hypothetical protein
LKSWPQIHFWFGTEAACAKAISARIGRGLGEWLLSLAISCPDPSRITAQNWRPAPFDG